MTSSLITSIPTHPPTHPPISCTRKVEGSVASQTHHIINCIDDDNLDGDLDDDLDGDLDDDKDNGGDDEDEVERLAGRQTVAQAANTGFK